MDLIQFFFFLFVCLVVWSLSPLSPLYSLIGSGAQGEANEHLC